MLCQATHIVVVINSGTHTNKQTRVPAILTVRERKERHVVLYAVVNNQATLKERKIRNSRSALRSTPARMIPLNPNTDKEKKRSRSGTNHYFTTD